MLERKLSVQAHPDANHLERHVLGVVSIAPVHEALVGSTGDIEPAVAAHWLGKLERLEAGAE